MNNKKKKLLIFTGGIIVLLFILNPSLSDFKAYTGTGNKIRKTSNFLLFSFFENAEENIKYLGFFKNFFELPLIKHKPNENENEKPVIEKAMQDLIAEQDSIADAEAARSASEESTMQQDSQKEMMKGKKTRDSVGTK